MDGIPFGCPQKKLIEAAECWARGGTIDHTADDLAAFGIFVPAADPEESKFTVWQENADAVMMFLRVTTQWRVGFNGAVGLDYTPLFQLFDLYAIDKDKRAPLFEDIQVMERAALIALRAKNGDN